MGDLEGWNAPGDLSRMRISDADRHRVAEVLRQAAGEGRLEFDELDERLAFLGYPVFEVGLEFSGGLR
jgi:hypothetical protein